MGQASSYSPEWLLLKLSKSDPFTGNNGWDTRGPPLLEASDEASESAHWFVGPFVEKNKGR